MKRFIIILVLLAIIGIAIPAVTQAHTCNVEGITREHGRILPHCTCCGDCNLDDFVAMFINLANFFLGFAGVFAIFFFISGTFTLVISSGSAERVKAGKATLLGAIIGLVIVFGSWTLINTIYFAYFGTSVKTVDGKEGRNWFQLKDPSSTANPACVKKSVPSSMLPEDMRQIDRLFDVHA